MIIWGGRPSNSSGCTALLDGARYNPAADSWFVVDTPQPEPWCGRFDHTAVWTGDEMIIWGGEDGVGRNTGARYDPMQGAWTYISSIWEPTPAGQPSGRKGHTAVWTGSRMIIWGGEPGLHSGGQYFASLDSDNDGVRNSCDCAPEDASIFKSPEAISNLHYPC